MRDCDLPRGDTISLRLNVEWGWCVCVRIEGVASSTVALGNFCFQLLSGFSKLEWALAFLRSTGSVGVWLRAFGF